METNLFDRGVTPPYDPEREWIKLEYRKGELNLPKLNISDDVKSLIKSNTYVPAILTVSEHVAHSLGINVGSLPWQIAVTSAMFTLTYKIVNKYNKNERTLPLHLLGNMAIIPTLFDRTSYALFYMRHGGRVQGAGEWANSVYPSSISNFLTTRVYGDLPILIGDLLALAFFTGYAGLQTLDNKFNIVNKTKKKILNNYLKVYDRINRFYKKSRLHKFGVKLGIFSFLAASGEPLLPLAPLAGSYIIDAKSKTYEFIDRLKKRII